MRKIRCVLIFITAVLVLYAAAASAAVFTDPDLTSERITDFASQAVVSSDGSVTFTESITVNSLGREIRRGIIREFPTRYKGLDGRMHRTRFSLVSAMLDGRRTSANITDNSGTLDIRLGDPDRLLSRGLHTFIITYRTAGWVAFHDDADELFWNVTGNGWSWPIDHASFSIVLPDGASVTETNVYTGRYGEKGADFRVSSDGIVDTTRTLEAGEGISVSFAWPKGFVSVPPDESLAGKLIGLISFAVIGGWFFLTWLIFGRDEKLGTIIPEWVPPFGIGPGFASYADKMYFDDRVLTAEIIQMAVSGAVKIEESAAAPQSGGRGGSVIIKPTEKYLDSIAAAGKLDKHVEAAASKLFSIKDGLAQPLELIDRMGFRLHDAQEELKLRMEKDGKKLFRKNSTFTAVGMTMLILSAFSALFSVLGEFVDEGMTGVFISMLMLCAQGLGIPFVKWLSKRSIAVKDSANVCFAMSMIAAALFFVIALFTSVPYSWAMAWSILTAVSMGLIRIASGMKGAVLMAVASSLTYSLYAVAYADEYIMFSLAASCAAALFFGALMPKRTKAGTLIQRRIEGLKLYMNTAERTRLEMLNPPEETPEMFERLLPYAYALGCADTWVNRFEKILADAAYTPEWYSAPADRPFSVYDMNYMLNRAVNGRVMPLINAHENSIGRTYGSSSPGGFLGGSGRGGGGFSGRGGGGGGGRGW